MVEPWFMWDIPHVDDLVQVASGEILVITEVPYRFSTFELVRRFLLANTYIYIYIIYIYVCM